MHLTARIPVTRAALFVRDERWLAQLHERIWTDYFADTPRANVVRVSFGAPWKNRLGLITMTKDQAVTYIHVNALLRWLDVPELVSTVTLAHEMVHYAHGFGSPLPKRYRHPHRGGIVKRELRHRGMAREYEEYEQWIESRWYDFYADRMDSKQQPSEIMELGQVASELPAE